MITTGGRENPPVRPGWHTAAVREVYLDHASTTPPHEAALEAITRLSREAYADPSRLYGRARAARIALDAARASAAVAIGARPEEIVFTSGGTESCNLAVIGGARAGRAA